jgi:hypothetical protein
MHSNHIGRRTFLLGAAGVLATGSALPSTVTGSAPRPMGRRNGKFLVRDYGGVPSTGEDMGPAIRATLDAARAWSTDAGGRKARVVFEDGTYRVGLPSGGAWYALEISDAERLALEGNGAVLLITDPHVGALSVTRSRDIQITDFVVDYELPPFTQGLITAVDGAAGTFDIALMDGYPTFADTTLFPGSGYGTVRDAATGRMKRGGQITFSFTAVTALGAAAWRVTVAPEHHGGMSSLAVGDGYVTGYRGDRNGIALYRSEEVSLKDVTIHAAPGAAVIAAECEETLISDCTVAIRQNSTRWISANADGVHNPGGRIGPRLLRNRLQSMHDDGINIYSKARLAGGTIAGDLSLLLGDGPMHVAVGDRLQAYFPATGVVRGTATVTSVVGDELSGAPLTVGLSAAIPGLQAGDEIYNLDYAASGFDVAENAISENRGLGICIRASDGRVRKNTLTDLAHWGMWVGNNSGYREGPVGVHDVVFANNAIVRPCLDRTLTGWPSASAAIMVQNFNAVYEPGSSQAHSSLSFRSNHLEDPPRFGIYIGGAQDVEVRNTTIMETVNNPRSAAPTAMLGIENVTDIDVRHLDVTQAQSARNDVWVGPTVSGYSFR